MSIFVRVFTRPALFVPLASLLLTTVACRFRAIAVSMPRSSAWLTMGKRPPWGVRTPRSKRALETEWATFLLLERMTDLSATVNCLASTALMKLSAESVAVRTACVDFWLIVSCDTSSTCSPMVTYSLTPRATGHLSVARANEVEDLHPSRILFERCPMVSERASWTWSARGAI